MTGSRPVKATRSSLMGLSRRLDQVNRGAALLEKRRDVLVTQLFARVRPTMEARRRIDRQAALAYRALVEALAAAGRSELATLGWTSRPLHMETPAPPAGAAVPKLVRDAAARALVPGQFEPAAGVAAQAFERLLEVLLATAPEEFAIRRLGRELAHTVRLVNVLERRVAVDLTRIRSQLHRTLEEREREEAMRLRRLATRKRGA